MSLLSLGVTQAGRHNQSFTPLQPVFYTLLVCCILSVIIKMCYFFKILNKIFNKINLRLYFEFLHFQIKHMDQSNSTNLYILNIYTFSVILVLISGFCKWKCLQCKLLIQFMLLS